MDSMLVHSVVTMAAHFMYNLTDLVSLLINSCTRPSGSGEIGSGKQLKIEPYRLLYQKPLAYHVLICSEDVKSVPDNSNARALCFCQGRCYYFVKQTLIS